MGQDADAIRHEIEETRERMGEKADALAYKADVPARTKDRVRDLKDTVVSAVSGHTPDRDEVASQVSDKMNVVGQKAQEAKGMAQNNPLGLAIGAAALGFLAGLAIPATKIENEKLGPAADDLKAKAKDLGSEALDRGKQVATEAAQAAKETAQETGQEQAQELKSSATDTMGVGSEGSEGADDTEDSDDSASSTAGRI